MNELTDGCCHSVSQSAQWLSSRHNTALIQIREHSKEVTSILDISTSPPTQKSVK